MSKRAPGPGRGVVANLLLGIAVLLGMAVLLAAPATAQEGLVDPARMPKPLDQVRYDQKLGAQLPLDARFVDETGRALALGELFDERPVVLAFVYYECPMLCTLILNGITRSLGVVSLDVGSDFDVVIVSFDPGETPAMALAAKERTLERYDRPDSAGGWHFLTGDETSIARLAQTAGFDYVYDPDTDEYAHASAIIVVNPDGVISQYYYGIEYPPKDVRLALIEASERRIGNLVDQLLLYCYRYDPTLGRYTAVAMRAVRLAGVAFVLMLTTFLFLMWRRERRGRRIDRETLGAV